MTPPVAVRPDRATPASTAALLPKPNLNPVKRGAIISNSYGSLTDSTVLGGINLIT
jgi:hypothetical protein